MVRAADAGRRARSRGGGPLDIVPARLQIFPILPLWYPKCARRIRVIHLSIFKAPSVDLQIWFPHITYLTCSENDSNSLQLGHANSVGRSFDYAEPTYS